MKILDLLVRKKHGIHLRIAAQIVAKLKHYDAKVSISKEGGHSARADSVLDLLSLAVTENSKIRVTAEGRDEDKVIDEVGGFFTDGAGI